MQDTACFKNIYPYISCLYKQIYTPQPGPVLQRKAQHSQAMCELSSIKKVNTGYQGHF